MSTFTKQAAQAARNLRAEAKRMTAKASLIKRPEVKAAFESFPLSMRRQVHLSMAAYSTLTIPGIVLFPFAICTTI